MNLSKQIEAILFFKGEPITRNFLCKTLNVSPEELGIGINNLKEELHNRGVVLMEKENEIMLGTAPEFSSVMEELAKEETDRELTKAALETLSIVLYRGPISRSEIDFIRGVNSTFILRNLLVRGLITRKTDIKDKRGFIYETSFDLLSHLGVTSIENLPKYAEVNQKVEGFMNESKEEE